MGRWPKWSVGLAAAGVLAAGCGNDDGEQPLVARDTALLTAGVAELRDAVLSADRTRALAAVVSFRRVVASMEPRLTSAEERALRTATIRIGRRIRADIPGDPKPVPEPDEADSPGPTLPLPDLGGGKGDGKGKRGKGKGHE